MFLCIYLESVDSWLLPLHLPDHESFEKFIYMHKDLPNDYYNDAVKHLQLALDLTPSASGALLPLIQVWSIHNNMHMHILWVHYLQIVWQEVLHFKLFLETSSPFCIFILSLFRQLLLMGGQVNEALNTLEKQCRDSSTDALPFRYLYLSSFYCRFWWLKRIWEIN